MCGGNHGYYAEFKIKRNLTENSRYYIYSENSRKFEQITEKSVLIIQYNKVPVITFTVKILVNLNKLRKNP